MTAISAALNKATVKILDAFGINGNKPEKVTIWQVEGEKTIDICYGEDRNCLISVKHPESPVFDEFVELAQQLEIKAAAAPLLKEVDKKWVKIFGCFQKPLARMLTGLRQYQTLKVNITVTLGLW